MNRFISVLLCIAFFVSCGPSKQVGYSHKPLAAEGCTVYYSALKDNGELQIVVTVKSDRLVFGDNPSLQLKNFNGDVLKLDGKNLHSHSESGGVLMNNVVIPITELNALAQFPISSEDIPFFESGVAKVRLSTLPIVHEKTFTVDVIGKYLYKSLRKANETEDSF